MTMKNNRLPQARCTGQELRIIKAAAKKADLTMTDYLVGSALERAKDLGVKLKASTQRGQGSFL